MRTGWGAIIAIGVVALLSACVSRTSGAPPGSTPPATSGATSGSTRATSCSYEADPPSIGKDVGLPTGTERTTGTVVLRTDQGEIKIALSGAGAPCTVRSFVHLVDKQYFDGSACHQLNTADGRKTLECGDLIASGRHGPGYIVPAEYPTELKPGPPLADGAPTVIYPRGTVAVGSAGVPGSTGSMFTLYYGDSSRMPVYAVFGTIDAAGLAVLDKIAAAGTETGGPDGAPKLAVTIQQAVVGS